MSYEIRHRQVRGIYRDPTKGARDALTSIASTQNAVANRGLARDKMLADEARAARAIDREDARRVVMDGREDARFKVTAAFANKKLGLENAARAGQSKARELTNSLAEMKIQNMKDTLTAEGTYVDVNAYNQEESTLSGKRVANKDVTAEEQTAIGDSINEAYTTGREQFTKPFKSYIDTSGLTPQEAKLKIAAELEKRNPVDSNLKKSSEWSKENIINNVGNVPKLLAVAGDSIFGENTPAQDALAKSQVEKVLTPKQEYANKLKAYETQHAIEEQALNTKMEGMYNKSSFFKDGITEGVKTTKTSTQMAADTRAYLTENYPELTDAARNKIIKRRVDALKVMKVNAVAAAREDEKANDKLERSKDLEQTKSILGINRDKKRFEQKGSGNRKERMANYSAAQGIAKVSVGDDEWESMGQAVRDYMTDKVLSRLK